MSEEDVPAAAEELELAASSVVVSTVVLSVVGVPAEPAFSERPHAAAPTNKVLSILIFNSVFILIAS